jgi:DNA-binding PadR family transcriptional regulator
MQNPFESFFRRGHQPHSHHHPHHPHHQHPIHESIGRHRGGGFFGGDDDLAASGREGRGRFGGGGRPGRMFGQGDLKLLLLALIEQQPRHGYELIRAIEELCGGLYTPSPGAIYPTLSFLEESGQAAIEPQDDSGKKKYGITAEGRAHLDQHRVEVEAVMQRLKLSSRMMAKLAVPEAVRESVHRLKHVLLGHDRHWSEAEIARVIGLIDQAAASISDGERQ